MKKHIIAFCSILISVLISVSGMVIFAADNYKEYTNISSTFEYSKTLDAVSVALKEGTVTVKPTSSTYNKNYKNITAISYSYDSNSKEYIEEEFLYDSGNASSYSKQLLLPGISLIRGVGQVGNSQSEPTGIKVTLIVNSRKTSYYPVPDEYR